MIDSRDAEILFDKWLSPKLNDLDFESKFPHYRRIYNNEIHCIDFKLSGSFKVFADVATVLLSDIKRGRTAFDVSIAIEKNRTRLVASTELQEFPMHPYFFCYRSEADVKVVVDDMVRAVVEFDWSI